MLPSGHKIIIIIIIIIIVIIYFFRPKIIEESCYFAMDGPTSLVGSINRSNQWCVPLNV